MADPTTTNPLEMSDEDFAKLNGPAEEAATAASETETDPNSITSETEAEASSEAETATAAEASAEAAGGEVKDEAEAEAEKVTAETKPESKSEPAAEQPEQKPDEKQKTKDEPQNKGDKAKVEPEDTSTESTSVDYETQYKKIMAPFKANGKMVELRSPEEAIQLMQMGANYTRKLQELQPHRKMLMMLQNNDLLDEGKLSFLIDLDRKNPEAIKKLVKDAGIDPMDIDTSVDPAYLPSSHAVSDQEVSFRTQMSELSSTSEGKETIQTLHSWDEASKQALWNDPSIMPIIHEQRQSGVYDLISDEVDRRRTLGSLPANLSFLQAYKLIGDEMVAQATAGQGGGQSETEPAGEKTPQVVATRAATPKPTVANGDKVSAASPTKTGAKKAEAVVNPLSMADDDFLKSMDGRV